MKVQNETPGQQEVTDAHGEVADLIEEALTEIRGKEGCDTAISKLEEAKARVATLKADSIEL